jgi:hypothetical protein
MKRSKAKPAIVLGAVAPAVIALIQVLIGDRGAQGCRPEGGASLCSASAAEARGSYAPLDTRTPFVILGGWCVPRATSQPHRVPVAARAPFRPGPHDPASLGS